MTIQNYDNLGLDTLCAQAGWNPKNGESRITPIVQSTTYEYEHTDDVADLFALKAAGHFYARISSPTVEVLEKKIAALEGGIGAIALGAGQTATIFSILGLAQSGDEIVASSNIYGGTFTLLKSRLPMFGITPHFVPVNDLDAVEAAINDKTRALFAETLSNPGVEVLDIEAYAELAHQHGIPLIVDNTFATPALCRPIDFGADIIVDSTTKYLDGHATSVGGAIVDSGRFDWAAHHYLPLTEPDPNYHGLSYTETFGQAAYLTRIRVGLVRDFGGLQSPFNAFLTNLGTETLGLRMERHSQNALAVAQYLETQEDVEWVRYPGLDSDPYHELAQKYLPKGSSGVIAFSIKGGAERVKTWIDSLQLTSLVVHVGDLRTYVLHPASMTHSQLTEEELKAAGIEPGQIRFSVGIENVEDILKDLKQAFQKLHD